MNWKDSIHKETYEKIVIDRLYSEENISITDKFELEPKAVTQVLEKALNAKNPKCRYMITFPTKAGRLLTKILPTNLLDWMFKI